MPEVVAPQPRVHGAARAAPLSGESDRQRKTIASASYYSEYHGHPVGDLEVLLPALRPRAVTWLVGDSSLDNKHWLFDARRDGSDTTALPLCAAASSKWPLGSATARQPGLLGQARVALRTRGGPESLSPLTRGSGATVIARQSLSSRGVPRRCGLRGGAEAAAGAGGGRGVLGQQGAGASRAGRPARLRQHRRGGVDPRRPGGRAHAGAGACVHGTPTPARSRLAGGTSTQQQQQP